MPQWFISLLVLTIHLPPIDAETPDLQQVIPPGHEALILEMVDASDAGAACRRDAVLIDHDHVRISYRCGEDDTPAALVLLHPTAAQAEDVKTGRFAIRAEGPIPGALREGVAAAIRAREEAFRWTEVEGFHGRAPIPPEERLQARKSRPEFPPRFVERAAQAQALYEDDRAEEALEIYLELARSPYARHANILGHVVASVASSEPGREDVDRYVADAEAHPEDALRQFLAGIAAHYSAHYKGRDRENRVWLYNRTIEYLERCEDAFPEQPRVYIYQAVSHYRLGHQDRAEALIEKAITLGEHDPDVYYCRAEIWHRKDPLKAIEDIDRYLTKTREIHEKHGDGPPEVKLQRVRKMREYLEAVSRGEAEYQEIFDPLDPDIAVVAAWEKSNEPTLPTPWILMIGGILVSLGAWGTAWLFARRRKSKGRPAP